jgi:hypothetical protein
MLTKFKHRSVKITGQSYDQQFEIFGVYYGNIRPFVCYHVLITFTSYIRIEKSVLIFHTFILSNAHTVEPN